MKHNTQRLIFPLVAQADARVADAEPLTWELSADSEALTWAPHDPTTFLVRS